MADIGETIALIKAISGQSVAELKSAIDALPKPVEYKFSDGDLLLGFGYSSTVDAVIVMNNGRANGLFDFAKLCTKPKGASLENLDTSDLTMVWGSGTDMHSPFKILATNNADGYHSDAVDSGFVGGAHTLDQMGEGFETASSVYVNYYADGKPVSFGYGICSHFEIKWANDIQAYNTVKQGGGGRACLREYHDMVFDGEKFNERITLKALEDIKLDLWYGLQCVSIGTTYTKIAFVDASNRGTFLSSDNSIASGNAVTSGFIGWGDDHRVEMNVNIGIDLGKRTYYNGTNGAFVSGTKGYFNFFNQVVSMSAGAMYYLDGSFRFTKNITESEPETLTLNKSTVTVESVDDTDTLTATHTPSSPSDVITWSSSDTNVATVDSSGVVTVHGIGTATITATCGQLTATATVTQASIKAKNALKFVDGKYPYKLDTVISLNAVTGQKTIGEAYENNNSVRIHTGNTNDVECIPVPYGATKVKFKTSDNSNAMISYGLIADSTDIVEFYSNSYPKFVSQQEGVYANTGMTVAYGQAVVFRALDATAAVVSYVYFE